MKFSSSRKQNNNFSSVVRRADEHSRSSPYAEIEWRLVKTVISGIFYRFESQNVRHFLKFLLCFALKAVAKLRDHNYERESPKTK